MIQLARVFTDGLVFQRGMPVLLWGESDTEQTISVRLDGAEIMTADIPQGAFSLSLPPQQARENATLAVGDAVLRGVDIGEVWLAGGQSNMEFYLEYTQGGEEEIAAANDAHLRMYTVGQYSFAGERELGYKAWNPWDRWLPYTPENAGSFSAVGVYFAKELRKTGVPVGILNCSWGGTSASAWLDKAYLKENPGLKSYLDDFEALVAKLDLARYNAIKALVRPGMASREARQQMGMINKYTFRPGELEKMMAGAAAGQGNTSAAGQGNTSAAGQESVSGSVQENAPAPEQKNTPAAAADNPLAGLSIEDIMAVGPGDPNEPGTLYENMVKEIAGYSVRGAIWYQGETDEPKAEHYAALFAALAECWRGVWRAKNAAQKTLPFLTVQLAPFGVWRAGTGERYPIVRHQQAQAAETLPDVCITSISDIGNVFDIHPKVKKPVGQRLALLARKYVYGEETLLADAPRAIAAARIPEGIRIEFAAGDGLAFCPKDDTSYNGFAAGEIPPELLPPVLGGVNGLRVLADGAALQSAECAVDGARLIIRAPELAEAKRIRVEFAETAFYRVNLVNSAGIPAMPFTLEDF